MSKIVMQDGNYGRTEEERLLMAQKALLNVQRFYPHNTSEIKRLEAAIADIQTRVQPAEPEQELAKAA